MGLLPAVLAGESVLTTGLGRTLEAFLRFFLLPFASKKNLVAMESRPRKTPDPGAA